MTNAQRFAMTHEQIAKVMGISSKRVWQLEQAGLRKIAKDDRAIAALQALAEMAGRRAQVAA